MDLVTAREEVAVADEARQLQEILERDYPEEFAGMWLQHEPEFRVVVAFVSGNTLPTRELVSTRLERYLETRTHKYSLQELDGIASSLPIHVASGYGTDVRANQIVLDVLAGDAASARESLLGVVPTGSVRVEEVPYLPRPIANMYAGLLFTGTCAPLGSATFGWSVEKDGTTLKGISTAGHAPNCVSYAGVALVFQNESLAGNSDSQWHTSTHTEIAQFKWHEDGSVRNVTAKRSYANVVVGDLVCKYGITTGYECGNVEEKNWDPDGPFNPLAAKWVEVENCGDPDDLAEDGDSGGPVFFQTTAIGITSFDEVDFFCPNKMLFNSITHVQNALGVHLLLAT